MGDKRFLYRTELRLPPMKIICKILIINALENISKSRKTGVQGVLNPGFAERGTKAVCASFGACLR